MSKKSKIKQILFYAKCMILLAAISFLCGFTTDTIINNMIEDKFTTIPLVKLVPDSGDPGNTQ